MKNIAFLFMFSIFNLYPLRAQMPQSFKYQGLARNQDLSVIKDNDISLRATILEDEFSGMAIYRETHQTKTSSTGLFSVNLGEGSVDFGDFSQVPWSKGNLFLKVEIDLQGQGNYEFAGINPLLAVPYAMHAHSADVVDDADADPVNEIQTLDFDVTNNRLTISKGNSVTFPKPAEDGDSDPFNEIQNLNYSASDGTLSISGGNSIQLPATMPDGDGDAENEIQTLSRNGNKIVLSSGGWVTDETEDDDADPSNELQTLSFDPQKNKLRISGGNEIDFQIKDDDSDPTNEIQKLSIVKTNDRLQPLKLSLSNGGNYIFLPPATVWDYHEKNNQLEKISTRVPVMMEDLFIKNIEVFDNASNWPYPQITNREYGFKTGNGRIGMRMGKDRLAYYRKDTDDDILMYLQPDGLRYYNYLKYVVSEMGANQGGGYLRLYPGSNTAPFFQVEKLNQLPELRMTSPKTKKALFKTGEANLNYAYSQWLGSNGSMNVQISATAQGNAGSVYVFNAEGRGRAGLYIDNSGRGVMFADVKNFRIDHPADAGKEIVYASLEGPEAAIYSRGTARLVNGEASIEFSEHFTLMLAEQGMTVILTPLSAESKGIAVVEKSTRGIRVRELMQGHGDYSFDWEVKGVRKGYEDFVVVRDKH